MGYLNGLTEASFKKDAVGRVIFYPWGLSRKGYILPSEEYTAGLKTFVRRFYIVAIAVIFVPRVITPITFAQHALLGVAVCILYALIIYAKVKELPKSNENFSYAESRTNMALATGLPRLIILEAIMILGFVGTFFLMPKDSMVALVFMAICFTAAVINAYSIIRYFRNR